MDAAVIGGKERWARRLDGLQNQFKQELEEYAKEEPDSPRVEAVRRKLRNLQASPRIRSPGDRRTGGIAGIGNLGRVDRRAGAARSQGFAPAGTGAWRFSPI